MTDELLENFSRDFIIFFRIYRKKIGLHLYADIAMSCALKIRNSFKDRREADGSVRLRHVSVVSTYVAVSSNQGI